MFIRKIKYKNYENIKTRQNLTMKIYQKMFDNFYVTTKYQKKFILIDENASDVH